MVVGHCPFLLLDEPTDGLDIENRQQFISRLGSLNVTRQILVITHEATTEAGQRITMSAAKCQGSSSKPPKTQGCIV